MTEKKIAMISQPMNGRTNEEIKATRNRAVQYLTSKGYVVINSFFVNGKSIEKIISERGVKNKPLYYLAKSLEQMAQCDTVYFCKDWENSRGCPIEHSAAFSYGLKIMYEDGEQDD